MYSAKIVIPENAHILIRTHSEQSAVRINGGPLLPPGEGQNEGAQKQ
jgi:hypothetical protein